MLCSKVEIFTIPVVSCDCACAFGTEMVCTLVCPTYKTTNAIKAMLTRSMYLFHFNAAIIGENCWMVSVGMVDGLTKGQTAALLNGYIVNLFMRCKCSFVLCLTLNGLVSGYWFF